MQLKASARAMSVSRMGAAVCERLGSAVCDAPCPDAKPPPKAYLRGGFAYWRRANVAFRLDGLRGHSRQCQCTPDPGCAAWTSDGPA